MALSDRGYNTRLVPSVVSGGMGVNPGGPGGPGPQYFAKGAHPLFGAPIIQL